MTPAQQRAAQDLAALVQRLEREGGPPSREAFEVPGRSWLRLVKLARQATRRPKAEAGR
jgi:hypothetical protein